MTLLQTPSISKGNVAGEMPATEDAGSINEINLELARDQMKNKKAPGLDNINPELIKQGWDLLAPHILELYNACLRHRIFPGVWKRGLVSYLVKAGVRNPSDPRSYRPICLLSMLGKLIERVILRLLGHMLETEASEEQYDFQVGRSMEDAITRLYDFPRESEAKCVDIQGAFNSLWCPSVLDA
jgi:Reverse transcriptase (RNA-dependent DNA polymerase).